MELVTRTANPLEKHVLIFCEEIAPGQTPVLLEIASDPNAELDNCFVNVHVKVERYGGAQVCGWAIWECMGILLEAEFHAVWEDDSSCLHDISPARPGIQSRLFLPDPKQQYVGEQVDNIRHPLISHSAVTRFITAKEDYYALLNSGDRSSTHGVIHLYGEEVEEMARIEARVEEARRELMNREIGRNERCPCGSGRKFKKCCGP